ncbi:outer membrane protein [Bartonella sp. CB169]|uniref:outer membrane protein n=1 Tax=Bartonella sp. CB169 TaxID=3112257 RepID=UPI00300E624D
MNTKCLIATSIFALVSASAVQAADLVITHKPAETAAQTVVAPNFTWTGFYLGSQAGGFSNKADVSIIVGKDQTIQMSKDLSPKLSGFVGGFYAGSSIDLGDSFIFSIDTDLIWSGKKHTKTITIGASDNVAVEGLAPGSRQSAHVVVKPVPHDGGHHNGAPRDGVYNHQHYGASNVNVHAYPHGALNAAGHDVQNVQSMDKKGSAVYSIEQVRSMISALGFEQENRVEALGHALKQNWTGATRMRIGFATDRFMPYISGGLAYAQLQDTVSVSLKEENRQEAVFKNIADDTKTILGYTLGGGVDFAMLDNVIVRAEYRYADFGKKKFANEKLEVRYKTNDFRVGVAYKF